MTAVSPDSELVSAYAADGSESAFRSLVARHVDLVFATAMRQVGDAGIAEEISQNVFVTLARKAPRLGGVETLAGWLHRTTVLEAKARIRAELRRRRREDTAAELAVIQREGASALDALAPLLDEALLNLRENDRLALVLRFLEDRSLREVGDELGIEEDAARKRVSRALEKLTEFFRQRGVVVPSGAGAVAVFANSTKAAPAGLSVSAAKAGLAAGGAAPGLNLILFHLMALTKLQTAVLCALVAAAPLAWQWRAEAKISREQNDATTQLASANRRADEVELQSRRAHDALLRTQTDTLNSQARLAALDAQKKGSTPRPVYRWDDSSPYVRVPKGFLEDLSRAVVVPADRRGKLNEQIKEVLQLTEAETAQVQNSIDQFLGGYQKAQSAQMKVVAPAKNELFGDKPENICVFEMPDVTVPLRELRKTFLAELTATLGKERFSLFRDTLEEWMPLDEDYHGLNSSTAVFSFKHRVRFEKPVAGQGWMNWSVRKSDGQMMSTSMQIDEIPDIYREKLQDWIDLSKSQPVQN